MRYFFNRIFKFDFKKLFGVINKASKISGKSKLFIFFDIIICGVLYKCGYADYEFLEMYKLSRSKRKNVVTAGINNVYVKKLNPKKYWDLVDNKYLFNERFKNYLGRSFMKLTDNNFDEFKDFVKDKDYVMVKPIADTWGHGIEKVKIDKNNLKRIYNMLLKNKQLLIEEVAIQHKDISKLHAESINTIRLVTLRNKYGVVSIIGAIIRMGTGHNVVDNFHNGGIYCPIDIETGKINGPATGKTNEIFDYHPTTNVKFVGYQLPNWDKVIQRSIEAANLVPELGYIGWDIYITDNDAAFIEGNQYPGHVLYKLMKMKDGSDILPIFKESMKKKEQKNNLFSKN